MEEKIVITYFHINNLSRFEKKIFNIESEADIACFAKQFKYDVGREQAASIVTIHKEDYSSIIQGVADCTENELNEIFKILCYPYLYGCVLYHMSFFQYNFLAVVHDSICVFSRFEGDFRVFNADELYEQFYESREKQIKQFKLSDWTNITALSYLKEGGEKQK